MRESEQPSQRMGGCWPLERVGKRSGLCWQVDFTQAWLLESALAKKSAWGGGVSWWDEVERGRGDGGGGGEDWRGGQTASRLGGVLG